MVPVKKNILTLFGIFINLVKILMVEKIFSKNYWPVLLLLPLTIVVTLFLFIPRKHRLKWEEERKATNSTALDFTLKAKLGTKVAKALSLYQKEGWEGTRKVLEEISQICRRGNCDPEIFFNESLDSLAETLANDKEFTYAASTLGILYPNNWELTDADGDQNNEVVILQRDALNVTYTMLKVVDFQEDLRVTSYKLEGFGYFSSPNSSGVGLAPIKTLDLTGDAIPEIVLFLSSGRGGAKLFVFQYYPDGLKPFFKKEDLNYPEYVFADTDGDGVVEILVRNIKEKSPDLIDLSSSQNSI
jgi:hypothetical protein